MFKYSNLDVAINLQLYALNALAVYIVGYS